MVRLCSAIGAVLVVVPQDLVANDILSKPSSPVSKVLVPDLRKRLDEAKPQKLKLWEQQQGKRTIPKEIEIEANPEKRRKFLIDAFESCETFEEKSDEEDMEEPEEEQAEEPEEELACHDSPEQPEEKSEHVLKHPL